MNEPCFCGHDFEDHDPAADGMLPLCAWCGCTHPRGIPDTVRKLRAYETFD